MGPINWLKSRLSTSLEAILKQELAQTRQALQDQHIHAIHIQAAIEDNLASIAKLEHRERRLIRHLEGM